jgi:hypothetical protein
LDDGLEEDREIGGKHEPVAAEHTEQPAEGAAEFHVPQRGVGDGSEDFREIGAEPLSIDVSCAPTERGDGVPERITVAMRFPGCARMMFQSDRFRGVELLRSVERDAVNPVHDQD